jgi:hypothetical protein
VLQSQAGAAALQRQPAPQAHEALAACVVAGARSELQPQAQPAPAQSTHGHELAVGTFMAIS